MFEQFKVGNPDWDYSLFPVVGILKDEAQICIEQMEKQFSGKRK